MAARMIVNTTEFAQTLLVGIKDFLSWLGIPHHVLDRLDAIVFLILIVIIAFACAALLHVLFVRLAKKVLRRKNAGVLDTLVKYKVFLKSTAIVPPLIISTLLPFVFSKDSEWFILSDRLTWIYFFVALTLSVNAILNSVGEAMKNQSQWKNRPMKGFIQILQFIFTGIAVIIIVSILINKSPHNLITGLGAFTAVLMLVFKDTILGLVAGVMISKDDMLRVGDWIEMPQNGINGIVIDISLDVVKVQNFDNTIVTVPPYSLVSGSFVNWRGMSESGGRRIMREYALKLDSVKPCTSEFLERMKSFDPDLSQYIVAKQQQAAEGKIVNTDNPEGLANGTIDTNLGLFRAYMTLYLRRHPCVSRDMLLMVRTLAPTGNGLPVQVYCFSTNIDWPSYESIQAEIMEHFVSVLPSFELYPFQNADARDAIVSGLIESGKVDLSTIEGIPWHTLSEKGKNPAVGK